MKRNRIILPVAFCAAAALAYQGTFIVFSPAADGITRGIDVERIDSVSVSGANAVITPLGQPPVQLPLSDFNDMRIVDGDDVIAIDMDAATVYNPYAFEGVTVSNVDRAVTVTSEKTA